MDTKDFILLKTLYEEKNITYTAKRLFMTQPALSERIKRLEKEFNCNLIIRQPRGIAFTSEGEQLYNYMQEADKAYQAIKKQLSATGTEIRGTLRLGCSNIFAKYHIPNILSAFSLAYPYIDINMYSGLSYRLYRRFLEGELDVTIVRGAHDWSEHHLELLSEPLCLFNKSELSFENLPQHSYIHYQTDPNLQQTLDDWWYSHYQTPPKTSIEVDDIDTCIKLVRQGLGFTLLTESCAQDVPGIYTAPLITKSGDPLLRTTNLYYRNNYTSMTPVKAFIDFIMNWKL